MAIYGYIMTSWDQEAGHTGSAPEVQRRQLVDVGVEPGRIYADVEVSGAKSGIYWTSNSPKATSCWWPVDRLGRRYLKTM